MKKRAVFLVVLLVLMAAFVSGCAVYKAATCPAKVDIAGLGAGSHRSEVKIELTVQPVFTEKTNGGGECETYRVPSGCSKVWSFLRAFWYGASDLSMFGLTELIFTPLESTLQKSDVRVTFCYDENNKVTSKKILDKK